MSEGAKLQYPEMRKAQQVGRVVAPGDHNRKVSVGVGKQKEVNIARVAGVGVGVGIGMPLDVIRQNRPPVPERSSIGRKYFTQEVKQSGGGSRLSQINGPVIPRGQTNENVKNVSVEVAGPVCQLGGDVPWSGAVDRRRAASCTKPTFSVERRYLGFFLRPTSSLHDFVIPAFPNDLKYPDP